MRPQCSTVFTPRAGSPSEGKKKLISDTDLDLIRQSFLNARKVREFDKSPVFYENFFRRAPDKKSMFRDDLAGQGMKFMATMQTIIQALGKPSDLDSALGSLAEGHAALGVRRKDFDPMCEALIDTLRDVLGPAFTSEMETAWRRGFSAIGKRMAEIAKLK